jgi:putative phage-type endonuclease
MITPTGWLATNALPGTPTWFATRRRGITGTDLAKLLGRSQYGTALGVWRDKRGEAPDDQAREAAKWGNILEDPVAQEWAKMRGTKVGRVGVLGNTGQRWMLASLDRIVRTCPDDPLKGLDPANVPGGMCGLEIKTRNAYKAAEFGGDEVPDDVLAQVQWGLSVTGFDHMHVAVLIGGQKLVQFRVDHDPKLAQYLIEAARPIWECVEQGVPPTVHPDSDGVLLQELLDMFRDREGDRELPPEEAEGFLASYGAAHLREKAAAEEKVEAKTGLVQLLGDGEVGLLDGVPVFTYRKSPDKTYEVTADNLRALQAKYPNTYASLLREKFITLKANNPTFRLKKRATTE